jgi:hypothetical protein
LIRILLIPVLAVGSKDKNYQISILTAEGLPSVVIKQNGTVIVNETVKSINDLKIFLEERLYKYLEG